MDSIQLLQKIITQTVKTAVPEPETLRQKVKLERLDGIPKGLSYYYRKGKPKIKNNRMVRYVAAAGGADIIQEPTKLRLMSDPYTAGTRRDFTRAAFEDPTLAPSLDMRNNAFYEKGIELKLELVETIDPKTKNLLTPQEQQTKLEELMSEFGPPLQKIRDWSIERDIMLWQKMKASHIATVVQGRSGTLITPGIESLGNGELPASITTLATEELGAPLVDVLKRKLVALQLTTKVKSIALMDEIIYCIRKNWGLHLDSLFYGASSLEPVLISSKGYRRVVNFDLPKAAVAAYLTKLLIKAMTSGSPATQKDQLSQILNGLVDDKTDIIGINSDVDVTPVQPKVDAPLIDLLLKTYTELLVSAGGSTMTQIGRTGALNRDTATIQEISNMKYVRTPDEELISMFYESQLLNPLLAHLTNKKPEEGKTAVEQMPVRINIVRREKSDEDEDSFDEKSEFDDKPDDDKDDETTDPKDTRIEQKKKDIEDQKFKQKDVEDKSIGS